MLKKTVKASDLTATNKSLGWNDSLLKATKAIAGDPTRPGSYRLPVLDQDSKVKGIILGRRILEIFLGRRGESIRKERGISGVLQEIVGLFCDEAHNLFDQNTPADAIIRFMTENDIGIIFLIDENAVFKGTINEMVFLSRMRGKRFEVRAEQIMQAAVHYHTTTPETPVIEAASRMVDHRVRRLPVISSSGQLTGLIAITDILQNILGELQKTDSTPEKLASLMSLRTPVSTMMRKNPVSLDARADVGEATDLILERDVSTVMICSDGEFRGIVSRLDLISGLTRHAGIEALIDLVV